jgi:hypothetical protein
MDLRGAKKPGKGKGKPKEKETRSNSSVTSGTKETADEEEVNDSDDTPKHANSAGDEFGRRAHMNKDPNWGDDN